MIDPEAMPTFAVAPVLVGPLQTLLALLPSLLIAAGMLLIALLTPANWRRAFRRLGARGLLVLLLLLVGAGLLATYRPWRSLASLVRLANDGPPATSGEWPTARGGPARTGAADAGEAPAGAGDSREPSNGALVWSAAGESAVYSSPAIVGDLAIFSTADSFNPLRSDGRGAIVAVDVETGAERWRYAPRDLRACYSSPVVSGDSIVCGEGLHWVDDAQVVCLDLQGRLRWRFPTRGHVESTPAIADGRVYFGAGDDGFYCLELDSLGAPTPRVVWRLPPEDYPDCESSPVVADETVYFGLGEGGDAICAVDARTGALRWRTTAPHPVVAPPTWLPASGERGARLIVGMGVGDVVNSASALQAVRLQELRRRGASEAEQAEAVRRLSPAGEVWSLDARTGRVEWRFLVDDAVLGCVAARHDRLYAAARDGSVFCLSLDGRLIRRTSLHEPIVSSPAVGATQLYVATDRGRLVALHAASLQAVWESSLGAGSPQAGSPTLARGRVYVGAARGGLRCIGGDDAAPTFVWNAPGIGGAADSRPLDAAPVRLGQWPPGAVRCRPLVPLALTSQGVVTVVQDAGAVLLTHLDFAPAHGGALRIAWQTPVDLIGALPPATLGRQIVTVERQSPYEPSQDVPNARPVEAPPTPYLVSRSVDDGRRLWRTPLPPFTPLRLTGDARQIELVHAAGVQTFSAAGGLPLWALSSSGDRPVDLLHVDDLLLLGDSRGWSALDGPGGGRLWRVDAAPGEEVRLLAARDRRFLTSIARADDGAVPSRSTTVELRRLTDGRTIWTAPLDGFEPVAGRLSDDHALLLGASGRWRLLRTSDGSPLEPPRPDPDPAAAPLADSTAAPPPLFLNGQLLYFDAGRLILADLATSRCEVWFDTASTGRPTSALAASGGRLYYVSERGKLVCVGAEESP